MPINPAIEEKAKAFTNNTPTTETDAEFLQRSYEFAQDIYQLGVSDGVKKASQEFEMFFPRRVPEAKHGLPWSVQKEWMEKVERIKKRLSALTKTS